MNSVDFVENKKRIYHPLVVFILISLVCVFEGFLHRNLDFMLINSLQNSTVLGLTGHYIHGFMYDNDIDQVHIHPEGYGLANGAYYLAGRFEEGVGDKLDIRNYGGDAYRILFPFLASFFLNIFSLHDSYVIVNIIIWILASYSLWWLGRYIFQSDRTALISGLLGATSYGFIVLVGTDKGEIFQIAYYFCLVALSFYLGQYSNDLSARSISNSILLGLFAGIGMFAGGSAVYFFAVMLLYGLISTRFWVFFWRSLVVLLTAFLVIFVVQNYLLLPEATSQASSVVYLISQLEFDASHFYNTVRLRFIRHFIYLIPWFLWAGAFSGLYHIDRRSLKIILCMFVTYLVAEFVMYTVQGSRNFIWTINYYYLQILLPVYLLNAKFIEGLIFSRQSKKTSLSFCWVFGAAYLVLILCYSNLALLGNRYNYYVGYRSISSQVLFHSWNVVDNLSVYQEMVK